jgi:hypothetical protein
MGFIALRPGDACALAIINEVGIFVASCKRHTKAHGIAWRRTAQRLVRAVGRRVRHTTHNTRDNRQDASSVARVGRNDARSTTELIATPVEIS